MWYFIKNQPTAPVKAVEPVLPVEPVTPIVPVAPVAPITPVAPIQPIVLEVPVQPIAPVQPIVPAPVFPVAPSQPGVPVRPCPCSQSWVQPNVTVPANGFSCAANAYNGASPEYADINAAIEAALRDVRVGTNSSETVATPAYFR